MSGSTSLLAVLRCAVLALLLAGVPVKPVLAVACAIADAQHGLVAGETGVDGDPWCCPDSACSDCCTQAATPLPALRPLVASMLAVAPPPALSIGFRPGAYPVAFRPPIAG